jgi:mono/diheme cytochrome c family protein
MRLFAAILALSLLTSCDYSMTRQPKYATYAPGPADIWTDGASARPLPNNVVSQSAPARQVAETSPPPVTRTLLYRGEERFKIYCSPCHGLAGDGDGVIIVHGFPAPPSYHSDRLLAAPARHFYDVISHGYGVMYAYAARIEPEDRWAIVAYIRALQLSRHATVAEAPEAEEKLR